MIKFFYKWIKLKFLCEVLLYCRFCKPGFFSETFQPWGVYVRIGHVILVMESIIPYQWNTASIICLYLSSTYIVMSCISHCISLSHYFAGSSCSAGYSPDPKGFQRQRLSKKHLCLWVWPTFSVPRCTVLHMAALKCMMFKNEFRLLSDSEFCIYYLSIESIIMSHGNFVKIDFITCF